MKAFLVGATIVSFSVAWTCCAVTSLGDIVEFGSQVNLVIWDEEAGVEHFVRKAHFRSQAEDLGFIAPTPSVPEIVEVDEEVFVTLEKLQPEPPFASKAASSDFATGGVEVIQETEVAGYLATTVKATDSAALADWMDKNGYSTTPNIERWTEFYIRKGWYLTAFKVKLDSGRGETGTVRMTFKTEKPFNPYVVPEDNFGASAGLKVYYVGSGKGVGTIGDSGSWVDATWSAPVKQQSHQLIIDQLKLDSLPKNLTLTAFDDPDFPRPAGDDVYFRHEADMRPLALMATGGAGLLGLWLVSRGKRRLGTESS